MGRFLAQILSIEGIFMIPALCISLYCGDAMAIQGFLWTIAIIAATVCILLPLSKGAPSAFYAKEGLVCVGVSWIVLSLAGCLPFYISREIPNYIDAFFEIVSGFTTTGASIVPEVEKLSKGILYWRSFSHWLGGMGVLVFLLAFTGGKGQGFTMHLLRAISYNSFAAATDLIMDGNNGILVENNNRHIFVEKLRNLMLNDQLRQEMSMQCVESSHRFSVENVATLWNNLLQSL